MAGQDELREQVRRRYAESALAVVGAAQRGADEADACCGPTGSSNSAAAGTSACCGPAEEVGGSFVAQLYDAADREALPDEALLASLGSASCSTLRSRPAAAAESLGPGTRGRHALGPICPG